MTSTRRLRLPVRQMFPTPSISVVDVCLTWTYNVLLLLRQNTRGDLTTRVMLSITEGKFGSSASRKTKAPVLYVHGDKKREQDSEVIQMVLLASEAKRGCG